MDLRNPDNRLLNALFPATSEQKIYINHNAPAVLALIQNLFKDLKRIMKRGIGDDLICGFIRYHLDKDINETIITPPIRNLVISISPNEVAFHGKPDQCRYYRNGDLVTVDISFELEGQYYDSAYTYGIGLLSDRDHELLELARSCTDLCARFVYDGAPVHNIGYQAEHFAEQNGFSIIKEACGHGIGKTLHTRPVIFFHRNFEGDVFLANQFICIEPVVSFGNGKVKKYKGLGYITTDGSKTAQFETMLCVPEYSEKFQN